MRITPVGMPVTVSASKRLRARGPTEIWADGEFHNGTRTRHNVSAFGSSAGKSQDRVSTRPCCRSYA